MIPCGPDRYTNPPENKHDKMEIPAFLIGDTSTHSWLFFQLVMLVFRGVDDDFHF